MADISPQTPKATLLDEFNTIVSETEQLLHSAKDDSGAEAGPVAAQVSRNLEAARERLAHLEESIAGKTKAAAKATDSFVRQHPWQAIGIAAALGLVVGMLLKQR